MDGWKEGSDDVGNAYMEAHLLLPLLLCCLQLPIPTFLLLLTVMNSERTYV